MREHKLTIRLPLFPTVEMNVIFYTVAFMLIAQVVH